MLPMPRASSSTWTRYRARMKAALRGVDLRVACAFWLFGLINNLFYVIILSAALDLVGPSIPKATVLLSSIIPGLATKLVVPYTIHLLPYSLRILLLAALSTCGMLVVALSPAGSAGIAAKVAGIVLANISSGGGEVNFLALTHFYGRTSLAAWGSGTGGAGLLGAGAYALATTGLGFSVQGTLLASAVVPVGMVLSYFCLLPLGPLEAARGGEGKELEYESVPTEDNETTTPEDTREQSGLLTQPDTHDTPPPTLRANLLRARALLLPYMLPLFLVYLAEYTINQGVSPTLLFPLPSTPFTHYRDFYPTYATIYQLGVFVSRSSLPFFRLRSSLYVPSGLQVLNLAVLTAHAVVPFLPSVWVVFGVVFWEGVLGGLVYVSTYAAVREEVAEEEREFSLGAVTVSDSAGIFVAGLLGVWMEGALCGWQVEHGRDWCRRL
ncbi:battenin CLN3 protein [Friedmanniomyces endolithicus]|uniref:Protein BTN n=1 Tax=Friedmanniomyces endolithicus TaxID=329885 RepID=A0AAN6G2S5_9PEZI|nr:battenin CLN3 protein [Friedmanniomyces endolithicus]